MSEQPQQQTSTVPVAGAVRGMLADTPLRNLAPVLEKWFQEDIEKIYRHVHEANGDIFGPLLKNLNITLDCARADIARIPAQGPVLVVANHPFGLIEGNILGSILMGVRKDVRFLANPMLTAMPEVRPYVFPIDPSGKPGTARTNWKSIRSGIEWLKNNGMLVIFPAGEVASLQFPRGEITEPDWADTVGRLVRHTNAAVLPIFFHGVNSPVFQFAGLVHPGLRTLLLPHEFLNKAGRTLRISIGHPIPSARLLSTGDRREITSYLRARTFMLERRSPTGFPVLPKFPARRVPVVGGADPKELRREMDQLPESQRMISHGEYVSCVASADQIPSALREIGRLRELTFRRAGEGTGRAIDLDQFDRYYKHLILWNREKGEIVGAYRIGHTDEIIARFGLRGLYTSTLFKISGSLYSAIQPALELGRSFVRPEYQKGYLPLLLLWQGLGRYVVSRPEYRILFGPVSISGDYKPASRALMVSFLKSHHRNESLAAHVRPRNEFHHRSAGGCDPRNFGSLLENVDELSEIVADLEPDEKGVPILIRQYLNLGGQILDFNVDRRFSQALDGLIVIDLAKAGRKHLERYMGRAGVEKFFTHHASQ